MPLFLLNTFSAPTSVLLSTSCASLSTLDHQNCTLCLSNLLIDSNRGTAGRLRFLSALPQGTITLIIHLLQHCDCPRGAAPWAIARAALGNAWVAWSTHGEPSTIMFLLLVPHPQPFLIAQIFLPNL